MEAKINRKDLLEKTKIMSSAIDKNFPIPAVRMVKMKFGKDIKLVATNSDFTVITSISDFLLESEENENTELLIDPVKAYSFLSSLKSDMITLIATDKNVTIKYGKSKMQMAIGEAKDFPRISTKHGNNSFVVDVKEFENALNKVKDSMSYVSTRPILNGVNMVGNENGTLRLQTTDSYRLSRHDLKNNISENFNIVIPSKCIKFILKNVNSQKYEKMKFIIENKEVFIQYGDYILKSRIIDGTFPNVDRILNQNSIINLKVSTDGLNDIIKKCQIVRDTDSTCLITLNYSHDDNKIRAVSQIKGISKIEDELDVEELHFDSNKNDISISFNADYLQSAIQNIDTNSFIMNICGELKPCFILDDLKEDEQNGIQVVVPVRTY